MLNVLNWHTVCLLVCPSSVTLSADAFPIPGGYVVPERGNVTFTCNSTSSGVLLWTVDLRIQGGTTILSVSAGLSSDLPNVSSPDAGDPKANPASFTIHYIAPESNWSSVECSDGTPSTAAMILVLVEGENIHSILC